MLFRFGLMATCSSAVCDGRVHTATSGEPARGSSIEVGAHRQPAARTQSARHSCDLSPGGCRCSQSSGTPRTRTARPKHRDGCRRSRPCFSATW